ncbi:hypothetical protein QKC54_gp0344 [Megavirus baoshan]|uniref:Uncharacterized protein n=1 Tax=Megavirus baoshan TaxID=2496520 RepID=A0A3S8UXQ6_9VIRU|nr:hypothetical protein QKC54_gp0344 [Megavirus baoshan]AZL89478.1 hypothetical protein Mb0728 [Megavirus baoshan]
MSKVMKKTSKSSPTSSEKNKKVKVFRYKNVDFKNVKVSDLKKGEGQPICYINYEDPQTDEEVKLIVQSGTVKLVDHGIPGIHEKYCPTDEKREFIKIPLDNSQPACVELRKHAEQADEFFGSNKMRKQIFKNRADDYQYQPIIRTPQEKDDDDNDDNNDKKKPKENKVRYDFIKMKFNMTGSGENRVNKTKLIELKGDKKVSVEADTITEIANNIRFLSEIKFIFYYTKVWANTSKPQGGGKKLYGVGFKVMAITYTPSKGKGVNVDDLEFDSDSDDNEVVEKSPKSKKNKLDDEDDDDNNNDNDNNEEDEEEPVKTSSKKSKHKNEEKDDDDDDEEQEEKPVTKNNKKPSKKSSKKSAKKVVSEEEEEEEEEEEIKPKKRASKNKSPSKNK